MLTPINFFNGLVRWKQTLNKRYLLITANVERGISIGKTKYKIVTVKDCLGSPLIINCLSCHMYIKPIIKPVEVLTH